MTEVKSDGSKISSIVVRVYPDRNQKDVSGQIPWDLFTDKVYFDVKDLYDDYEEKNFVIEQDIDEEMDGEIFGWNLTDSWHHIGNVYYFMLSVFNLIETQKDESPIIDTRGNIQGKLTYSVKLEVFDSDGQSKLNILDYETLNELIGKTLKFNLDIRKVGYIPDKYTFKTCVRYNWMDSESQFETKQVERQKDPEFNYQYEHTLTITEDLIHHLMYNTLTLGVYGMIESKKRLTDKKTDQSQMDEEIHVASPETGRKGQGQPSAADVKKIRDLERENNKLKAMLEKERNRADGQTACCTIFWAGTIAKWRKWESGQRREAADVDAPNFV